AIAVSGGAGHRNDRLGADLEVLPRPDEPWLYRPSRRNPGGNTVDRGRKGDFNERNHVVERWRDANVLHMMLQVFEAVFKGEAIIEIIRIGDARAFRFGREVETQIAG